MGELINFKPIDIEVDGVKYHLEPQQYIKIDTSNLKQELIDLPEKYTFWGYILSAANRHMKFLGDERKRVVGSLNAEVRGTATRKLTKDEVESIIHRHEDYIEINEKYRHANAMLEYIKSVTIAIYKNYDQLKELCNLHRMEEYNAPHSGVMTNQEDPNFFPDKKDSKPNENPQIGD